MKFPDTIYVTMCDEDTDDECLISHKTINDIPDDEEAEQVAIYKLVSTGKLVTTKILV